MKKKTTIYDLAVMMKKGFDGVIQEFGRADKKASSTLSSLKLTRAEMATSEEQAEIKNTVNSIWKMLDDELGLSSKCGRNIRY